MGSGKERLLLVEEFNLVELEANLMPGGGRGERGHLKFLLGKKGQACWVC
jgi:hypothetical protein